MHFDAPRRQFCQVTHHVDILQSESRLRTPLTAALGACMLECDPLSPNNVFTEHNVYKQLESGKLAAPPLREIPPNVLGKLQQVDF